MITTRLQGGIGNQMFQFAMGLAQAKRLGVELRLDISALRGGRRSYQLDQWHRFCPENRAPVSNEYRITINNSTTINENGMPHNPGLIEHIKDGAVLNGYWQTEKYFKHLESELRGIFHPRTTGVGTLTQEDQKYMAWLERIQNEPESVMVHVRHGDYLTEPHHSYHGVLPLHYYKSQMDYIRSRTHVPKFFMFSDDEPWVRANFVESDVVFIDAQCEAQAISLMSKCRHSIIANSSFSWWGAWLGQGGNDEIRIAPKEWFAKSNENTQDIIPDFWKVVSINPPSQKAPNGKVLIAVNSWDIDATRGCHQAIRETWGKHVAPADLRFFLPRLRRHELLPDEVYVDVNREYDFVCREVVEILRWSLQEGYDFTYLISNDVFLLPQKLLNSGFEKYDYSGFFHEQTPLGEVATEDYECTFKTADGYGIKRKLYNWADGGDGRMLSRRAAEAIVASQDAAYWLAADDIFIGQVLGPMIATGDIKVWNMGYHKDDIPDNGYTWHHKSYPEHANTQYDPATKWMNKMYEEKQ